MYIAYDDEGIITTGTKRECLDSIRDWSTTEEAEMVYNEDDLGNIYRFFNKEHLEEGFISYYGFTVKQEGE